MRWLMPILLGWVLLYSRHGNSWEPLTDAGSQYRCEQLLDARVAEDVQGEIGGALAGQSADNPMRQDAARRAERHVRDRYRCAETR